MKRKRKNEESTSGNNFIVLYVSLSVILLSFFVVINSIATIDASRKLEALGSLLGSFGAMPGGVRPDKGDEPLMKAAPMAQLDITSRKGEMAMRRLAEYIEGRRLEEDITIHTEKEAVTINLSEKILFAPGESDIFPSAYPVLDRMVSLVRNTTNDIIVEGHTDNTPVSTAKFPSNWELSGERAVSVVEYLLKDGSISEKRLAAAGYGEFNPRVANDTSRGRASNRRVSIVFSGKVKRKEAHRWHDLMTIKGFIFKLKSAIWKRES